MEIIDIFPKCSFGWEKIKEMKDKEIEFWAADGLTKLRIFEIDEREKSFYMVNQLGKRTWPFNMKSWKSCTENFTVGK